MMEESQCCVCYIHTREFTPCAHCLCSACCSRLEESKCPLCRQEIERSESQSHGMVAPPAALLQNVVSMTPTARQRILFREAAEGHRRLRPDTSQQPLNNYQVSEALLEPLPNGPVSSRPYLRRSWLLVGLPSDEDTTSTSSNGSLGLDVHPVVRRLAQRGRSGSRTCVLQPLALEQRSGSAGSTASVERQKRCRSTWSIPGFPDAATVAAMDAQAVAHRAQHLLQLPKFGQQHKALARALAHRARHLARVSVNLEGGHLQLPATIRALRDAGLLEDVAVSEHLQYLDHRIHAGLNNDMEREKLREHHCGISGEPLSLRVQQLDCVADALSSSTVELQQILKLLHKSGLLSDGAFTDHYRYLDNRISELNQRGGCPSATSHFHKGLSGDDLRQRAQTLHCVIRSLVSGALQLHKTVKIRNDLGFVADDEALEHLGDIDRQVARFKQLEASLPRGIQKSQRSLSLPGIGRRG